MSTSEIIQITIVTATCLALVAVFLWSVARRRQTEVTSPPAPIGSTPEPVNLDSLIQTFSQRLASVEGRVGSLAAGLEGLSVLQQRVAGIETHMPALQEAYEKYADQVYRADKRDTERTRVERKKESNQTAGEAAAVLSGAAGGGGNLPTQPAAPQNESTKRAGVLGQGGRHR